MHRLKAIQRAARPSFAAAAGAPQQNAASAESAAEEVSA
jgi:L-ribulokinase